LLLARGLSLTRQNRALRRLNDSLHSCHSDYARRLISGSPCTGERYALVCTDRRVLIAYVLTDGGRSRDISEILSMILVVLGPLTKIGASVW
jgi:hypothetical protein